MAVALLAPGRDTGETAAGLAGPTSSSTSGPPIAARSSTGAVRAEDLAAELGAMPSGRSGPARPAGGTAAGAAGASSALVARSVAARGGAVTRSDAVARAGATSPARRTGSASGSLARFGRRRAAPVHPAAPAASGGAAVDEVLGSIAAVTTSTPGGTGQASALTTSQLLDLKDWINRAVDDRLRAELERRGVIGGRW